MSRTLFILTGASRGFGRSVALAFASSGLARAQPVDFLLVSRQASALGNVAREIEQVGKFVSGAPECLFWREPTRRLKTSWCTKIIQASGVPKGQTVTTCEADFSHQNLEKVVSDIFTHIHSSNYTKVYLINNAGSLGQLARIRDQRPESIQLEIHVNVTAPMILTAAFLKRFASSAERTVVVNVSSLAGIQPFDCWGVYAAGKAARDMFHSTIALEEAECEATEKKDNTLSKSSSRSRVRVLSYAPGPMDTQMQTQIRSDMPDVPLKDAYIKMHQEGKLVNADDSAKALSKLLEEDTYENGAHIDFYDV
ncbi:hypothetical protein HK104_001487 [Borealophlyctis nickersoniae]|nr:hypothetical protein HK104_001487 [Borealophlyctis nickersoniae]